MRTAGIVLRRKTCNPALSYRGWYALKHRTLHDQKRYLQSSASNQPADFAFAFDVDGVLLRHHDPIPRARETLRFLQSQGIPFILLTNGGGKHEADRVAELEEKLDVPLKTSLFVQSHTPFADLQQYKDKTILVVGGEGDTCRHVAQTYGFKSVVTPMDIMVQHPSIWPFSTQFINQYERSADPLPMPIDTSDPSKSLKVDAIFVYNDPRDWGLDAAVIIDLLLSKSGIMGTLSPKNNDSALPNRGYQQDGQPPLYYSNPDLWWAAKFHLPRLGQGAFREAVEGMWSAITGGEKAGVKLEKTIIGKPYHMTYEFAEKKLVQHRHDLYSRTDLQPLRRVYMIGDNPESDIRGGNSFKSPQGTKWSTILVKTGVHQTGEPVWKPSNTSQDVFEAVRWALSQEGWPEKLPTT